MRIHEIFYSLQGEGRLAGTPSIFLRTAGCNLRCTYCDTTYAYEKGTEMTIQEILDEMKKYPCTHVCVTGGEPLMQKETPRLIDSLLKKNYSVCLETNGSRSIKKLAGKQSLILSLDIKCPSSGSHEQMDMTNIMYLSQKDQIKFIIKDKEDYEYAKKILDKYKPGCPVFFQPVWGTDAQKLAAWILRDGLSVRLSVQLHKIIWGLQNGV
jgi:7-carboxy-7-deazaguanine synthase